MSSRLFGNGTNLVHWEPTPNTRGTFDILSTCLITMLLCVWTAVHLNVSPPGSFWEPKSRKIGWLILALLAPEMVAYTAWYQRQEALSVMREINEAYKLSNPLSQYEQANLIVRKAFTWLKTFMPSKQAPTRQPTLESQKSSSAEPRHSWTLVHGFYAIMGGIAFEIPETASERFLPAGKREFWFLTPSGLRFISRQESIFPNISKEEIESKSKANGVAKTLVCIQATWFIAQCITRLAQHIPISLLELNTFGHAICALLIYFLWWEKPFEVDYPTMIRGQSLWDSRALIWMQNNRSSAINSFINDLKARLEADSWFQSLSEWEKQRNWHWSESEYSLVLDFSIEEYDGLQSNSNHDSHLDHENVPDRGNETSPTVLTPGQVLKGTGFGVPKYEELIQYWSKDLGVSLNNHSGPHVTVPSISLTTQDVTRWKMAWRARRAYKLYSEEEGLSHEFSSLPPTIVRSCEDWPDTYDIMRNLSIFLGFSAAAFMYGGLHALAWFAHFDSSTERLLWRISACVVMGGIPVMFFLVKLSLVIPDSIRKGILLAVVWDSILYLALVLVLLVYLIARAYLVVECFINLSHLPAGVYDVPSWSAYFPHIS